MRSSHRKHLNLLVKVMLLDLVLRRPRGRALRAWIDHW